MQFGLPEIELGIIAFTDRPGQVENSGLCFKCQSQPRTDIRIIQFYAGHIVPSPAPVEQQIEKRILSNQISELRRTKGEMGKVLALFIKAPEQFISPDLE